MTPYPWGEMAGMDSEPGTMPQEESSLCTMCMGDEVFGIDTARVREVLRRTDRGPSCGGESGTQMRYNLRPVPLAPSYVAGIIPYRGEVLTTLSLQVLLNGRQERPGGFVLVLDDEGTGERFGLMVDGVIGAVMVRNSMLEGNPCTLDARSRALFDGMYKTPGGLVVRINPALLNPMRLAATGLFSGKTTLGGA